MTKKPFMILLFLSFILSPALVGALTNEEREGRAEIEQGWVDRHNDKLIQPIKDSIKKIKKKHTFLTYSRKDRLVRMKRLPLSRASKHRIPMDRPFPSATPVPLAALYQAEAQGYSFLIADYSDDYDTLHSSSDIYIKIGLIYRPVFHGEGYRGCARILTLGKDSPLFFELGTFGGGTACKKVVQTLDMTALKNLSQDLYDHPESVKPADYVKQVLEFNVWLEGFTLYMDVDGDGTAEIVNCTKTDYPLELRKKMQDKYHQEDNEFGGDFRKIASFYKWNQSKVTFENIGDYYY